MARPTFTISESEIKNNLISNIKNRLGSVHEGKDSAFMAFSESIGDELTLIRRENEARFDSLQISNASGENLDSAAMSMYGLQRRPASRAATNAAEANVYFYVEDGTFGDINNGNDIVLPEGVKLFVKTNAQGDNIFYELTASYTLAADQNVAYCAAQSADTGFAQNVDKQSLNFHDFTDYTKVTSDLLKVSNRFAILNGTSKESDRIFRSRLNNYLAARMNLNEDWVVLKAIMVPGVVDIRTIPNYFGIGTLGLIIHGAGKESNDSLLTFVDRRVREIASPGLSIEVIPGISVYLDFDIRVYIKPNLTSGQKQFLKSSIKENVYRIIETAEQTGRVDFSTISSYIKSAVATADIIGFGSATNGTLFEKIYERKSDRFNHMPEYREELVSNAYTLEDNERLSFGVVNIILEEGDA